MLLPLMLPLMLLLILPLTPPLMLLQVKKLWRWRPTPTANPSDDFADPTVALEAFMQGLRLRLGLGDGSPAFRVR